MPKKEFGVLVDDYYIKRWQYKSIEKIIHETGFTLKLVIVNENKKLKSVRLKNILHDLFKYIFTNSDVTQKADIRNLLDNANSINCTTQKKGKFSEIFRKDDIDEIKSYKLDFILRFGFGILKGEILNSAKYGIWSFHHGDNRKYRGGPYCFWEIYNNDAVTGAILQKLTDKLDGGVVLKRGYFKTISHSYKQNISNALELSCIWPSQVCKSIEVGCFKLPESEDNTDAKIFKAPSNLQMLLFLLKLFKNRINYVKDRYFKFDCWNIGIVHKQINSVLKDGINKEEVEWLNLDKDKYYYADPFLFNFNKMKFISFERILRNNLKGELETLKIDKEDFTNLDLFNIEERFHLSYPNFFWLDEKLHCLPEVHESNKLILYEWDKDKSIWNKNILLENGAYLDADIIFRNDKYWLFTTIKGANHSTNMYLYYSNNIRNGWEGHILNPVVSDVRSARGGGKIFEYKGALYRPGQNYSVSHEGSLTISKIKTLTEFEYSEEIVEFINPLIGSKYPDKIHTINSLNNLTVIDAAVKQSVFRNPRLFFNLSKKLLANAFN